MVFPCVVDGGLFFKNHVRCSYLHANFDNKHVNNILFIFLFISSDGTDCNSIVW
jgi:hypothetical protein